MFVEFTVEHAEEACLYLFVTVVIIYMLHQHSYQQRILDVLKHRPSFLSVSGHWN